MASSVLDDNAWRPLWQEIQRTLEDADEQWRSLESRLEWEEEALLNEKFEKFRSWLDLKESTLAECGWVEGSLRQKIRGRVQKLILGPLCQKMYETVYPQEAESKSNTSIDTVNYASDHVLDALRQQWELQVKPLFQDTEMDPDSDVDPKVSEGGLEALDLLIVPIRRLEAFLLELRSIVAVNLRPAIPAVVGRAACDWVFQRCVAQLEQLDGWWTVTQDTLQQDKVLWSRLLEAEGIFVHRIQRGIEVLLAERERYETNATFGGNEVDLQSIICDGTSTINHGLEENIALLAKPASTMTTRLQLVCDSAAWRVIDAAHSIQKELRATQKRKTLWECTDRDAGAAALLRELGPCLINPEGAAKNVDNLSGDAALALMQRLNKLTTLVVELQDYFSGSVRVNGELSTVGGGGTESALREVLVIFTEVKEDLLALLDDLTPVSMDAWRLQWSAFEGGNAMAQQIDSAMAAVPPEVEAALTAGALAEKQSKLMLLRGVQAILDNPEVRANMAAQYIVVPKSPENLCRPSSALSQSDVLDLLSTPTSMPASPRSGYRPRSALSANRNVSIRFSAEVPEAVSIVLPPPATEEPDPPLFPSPPMLNQNIESPLSQRSSEGKVGTMRKHGELLRLDTPTIRPTSPSWLLPPWPRPDRLFSPPSECWTRPTTPSTICEDLDHLESPKMKLVDGQLVARRPATIRLRPLKHNGHHTP